jgi:hypothetical protein
MMKRSHPTSRCADAGPIKAAKLQETQAKTGQSKRKENSISDIRP